MRFFIRITASEPCRLFVRIMIPCEIPKTFGVEIRARSNEYELLGFVQRFKRVSKRAAGHELHVNLIHSFRVGFI